MKQKIEQLLQEHKLARQEALTFLNELTATNISKMSFEEKELVRKAVIELSVEESLRAVFISELEGLLS